MEMRQEVGVVLAHTPSENVIKMANFKPWKYLQNIMIKSDLGSRFLRCELSSFTL